MRPLLIALFLTACAASASADEVLLKNGAKLEGTILEEGARQVVIKTTSGAKMTIPRGQVESIVRREASQGAKDFAAAKRALKRGERAEAVRLLERAAASEDPSAVRAAKDELARLEKGGGGGSPAAGAGRFELGEDPFDPPETESIVRELQEAAKTGDENARARLANRLYRRAVEHEQGKRWRLAAVDFARTLKHAEGLWQKDQEKVVRHAEVRNRLRVTRDAVRKRDARLALRAAEPAYEAFAGEGVDKELQPSAAYFYGRALELNNRRETAIRAYGSAFETQPHRRDVETYRELARLAAVGVKIDANAPGVSQEWIRIETAHFTILAQGQGHETLGKRFEEWRTASLERLKLQIPATDRIQVFCYRDRDAYLRSDGARSWSAGHATRLRAAYDENEVLRVIYFFPSQSDATVARHEIAHILTWDSLGMDVELPLWALEGAAIYAEPANVRVWRRQRARTWRTQLDPTETALGRMLLPKTKNDQQVSAFYAQSGVNFDLLAEKVGVDKAFQAAIRINTQGPKSALRSVGLDLRTFERSVEQALGGALPQKK